MRSWRWLASILVGLSGPAIAEEGCPDGYVPVFQGGTQNRTCVADYNLPYWNQHQDQGRAMERWEDRWGAIAADDSHDLVMGVSTDAKSERAAKKAAIEDCLSRGGANCRIGLVYRSQCAAAVASTKQTFLQGAAYEEDAQRMAMERCTATGEKCWIYYSGCSLPVRVQ